MYNIPSKYTIYQIKILTKQSKQVYKHTGYMVRNILNDASAIRYI